MTLIISFGILFALSLGAFFCAKYWNLRLVGTIPVSTFTFIAILFTSGLDVGLIMLPLVEFPVYADLAASPEYAFSNPLAIEFGFWAFMIWAFYFLTTFYFCVIEPRVKFFEILWVRIINNVIIIGTCAFTAYIFLSGLPSYLPEMAGDNTVAITFYVIVFCVIVAAAHSSTDIKFVKVLSVTSTWLFFALIAVMWLNAGMSLGAFGETASGLTNYFTNIHKFVLPLNDYHEFYLFWWFAWSIMIGQFTSRFVGGMRTWQVFLAITVVPSIPIAIWFSVLYYYHLNSIDISVILNMAMVLVGTLFVINSLDSLIRLYSDNLGITVKRFGYIKYVVGNVAALFGLTLLFQSNFLQIQWIGAGVIGLYLCCLIHILMRHRAMVWGIKSSPAYDAEGEVTSEVTA